ncbi:MAG: RNA-binding protein [Hyperthermus sp.]|nr:MAG: RNA-binding protein [Hyperthermus sp.]
MAMAGPAGSLGPSGEEGLVRLRVRGIYATALTQWALDSGFQVVQASRVISDRFGIPQLNLPPHVTLKTVDDEPSELLVVGYTWAASRVIAALRSTLKYSFYWVSKLPLHSTVKARVEGRGSSGECLVSVLGVKAVLEDAGSSCRAGDEVVAGVVRPAVKPGELPRVRRGARLVGDYAIVYASDEPRVTVSKHVRSNTTRAMLLSIGGELAARGLSIHWRSSSRFADEDTLRRHAETLARRLAEAAKKAEEGREGVYSEGETVAVVRLSRPDKERLDALRARTTPTIPLHHSVKSIANTMSIVVDYAEKLVEKGVDPDKLAEALLEMQVDSIASQRTITIIHVKPTGEVLELGPAIVKHVEARGKGVRILLERTVKGKGVYDGIGARKEPGDKIVTEIDTSTWITTHRYYSRNGELKGTYYNINTPPEIGDTKIIYMDLEIDVAKNPGEQPRILDRENLDRMLTEGVITRELYEKALKEAENILRQQSSRKH